MMDPQRSTVLTAQGVSPLRLSGISNVESDVAPAPRCPLNYGWNHLAVVYRGNESGKSSLVHILNHLCRARHPDPLHPESLRNWRIDIVGRISN